MVSTITDVNQLDVPEITHHNVVERDAVQLVSYAHRAPGAALWAAWACMTVDGEEAGTVAADAVFDDPRVAVLDVRQALVQGVRDRLS